VLQDLAVWVGFVSWTSVAEYSGLPLPCFIKEKRLDDLHARIVAWYDKIRVCG
jgi:hypothetical protein